MRRPLFYPLMALIAGIIVGDRTAVSCIVLAFAALPALILLLWSVRNKWNAVSLGLILFLFFLTGLFNISQYQYLRLDGRHIMHYAGTEKLSMEGVVLSEEDMASGKRALIVQCFRIVKNHNYRPVNGHIRLVVASTSGFERGDFVRFRTIVRTISSFNNPGHFDYKLYQNRRGIFVSGFIADPTDMILIRRHQDRGLEHGVDHFRRHLRLLIATHVGSPEGSILEAMAIGNQKSIPPDILDMFAKTGTSHILSISGLHVGIVSSFAFFLALLLLKSSEYLMLRFNITKVAAAVSLIPVLLYTMIAGMGTPVLRSAFMVLAFLIALMIARPKDSYNILFGAAGIILIIMPEVLFEISFQLSFSAVFALIYIVPRFSNPALPFLDAWPHWLKWTLMRVYLFCLVSVAATVGTLPIIVYYFNRISTVTVVANLLAVPLLGILTLLLIFVFILTALFSAVLSGFVLKAASFFVSVTVKIIGGLSCLPGSSVSFVKPDGIDILLFYILLFGMVELLTPVEQKNSKAFATRHPMLIKTVTVASLAFLVGSGAYLYWKDATSTDLKLTAIDVGQGSATLVEFPGGARMLIDGGGFRNSEFDMGKSVIAPFLYAKKIRTIDIVALTHPHPDHLQGLIYVVNNFNVREVWTTAFEPDDDLFRLWKKTLAERKMNVRYLTSSEPAKILHGAKIECLWPDSHLSYAGDDDINDLSLVLKITFGDSRFLITGDITSRVEDILLNSGKNLQSDLILAPHHGSVYSSSPAFIRAVSPRYVIFSCGKNNVFGHPHPEVLKRYHDQGTAAYRTDIQGAVTARTDGKSLEIRPWLASSRPGH